MCKCTG